MPTNMSSTLSLYSQPRSRASSSQPDPGQSQMSSSPAVTAAEGSYFDLKKIWQPGYRMGTVKAHSKYSLKQQLEMLFPELDLNFIGNDSIDSEAEGRLLLKNFDKPDEHPEPELPMRKQKQKVQQLIDVLPKIEIARPTKQTPAAESAQKVKSGDKLGAVHATSTPVRILQRPTTVNANSPQQFHAVNLAVDRSHHLGVVSLEKHEGNEQKVSAVLSNTDSGRRGKISEGRSQILNLSSVAKVAPPVFGPQAHLSDSDPNRKDLELHGKNIISPVPTRQHSLIRQQKYPTSPIEEFRQRRQSHQVTAHDQNSNPLVSYQNPSNQVAHQGTFTSNCLPSYQNPPIQTTHQKSYSNQYQNHNLTQNHRLDMGQLPTHSQLSMPPWMAGMEVVPISAHTTPHLAMFHNYRKSQGIGLEDLKSLDAFRST